MTPKFQVQLKIRKPVAQVFQAVVDPAKLSGYFISLASGPLEPGQTVSWSFPEMPGEAFDVVCREVAPNERIVFDWPGEGDYHTRVWMTFTPLNEGETMVQISEGGWPDTEAGSKASHGNAGGWMHMLASLKAYLEYGINLREGGAF